MSKDKALRWYKDTCTRNNVPVDDEVVRELEAAQCVYCQMDVQYDDDNAVTYRCGTEYDPVADMHLRSVYCATICEERLQAEVERLKALTDMP